MAFLVNVSLMEIGFISDEDIEKIFEAVKQRKSPINLIGACKMKTMRCQATRFPMVYVVSVILLLYSVIQLLNSRKE